MNNILTNPAGRLKETDWKYLQGLALKRIYEIRKELDIWLQQYISIALRSGEKLRRIQEVVGQKQIKIYQENLARGELKAKEERWTKKE